MLTVLCNLYKYYLYIYIYNGSFGGCKILMGPGGCII